MRRLLSDVNNDSPDIGPPPKTFFDRDEEAKQNDATDDHGLPSGLLSANFEKRRKRRETRVRLEDTALSGLDESPYKLETYTTASGQPVSTILRAGAKRKLDWRNHKDYDVLRETPGEGATDFVKQDESQRLSPKPAKDSVSNLGSPVRRALEPSTLASS